MGLRHPRAFPFGPPAASAHWHLRRVRIDFDAQTVELEVDVYVNQAAKLAGGSPFAGSTFTLDGDDYAAFMAAPVGALLERRGYTYLKTTDDLDGAVNE